MAKVNRARIYPQHFWLKIPTKRVPKGLQEAKAKETVRGAKREEWCRRPQ